MADREKPRSWQLVQAMVACLQQIRTAAGYRTDAGANVTDEPSQVPDESNPILLAVMVDTTQRPTDPNVPLGGKLASIAILAKISCDFDNGQEVLHDLIDDIDFAVQGRAVAFPKQTTYPRFASSQQIPGADGINWIGVELRYDATYLPLPR